VSVRIITGDCRATLADLEDASIHCCVTSPPYWGLRDYGHPDQIGLEKTPAEYVTAIVGVFREVRRALRGDGTCWVNLGDSYAGARGGGQGANGQMADRSHAKQRCRVREETRVVGGLKSKDLVGIPWRVAFALQDDGWYLRSDIIWAKPNPMPESVGDRPTKAHEYVFLLAKSERYYFDQGAVAEPVAETSVDRQRYALDYSQRAYANGATVQTGGRRQPAPSERERRNIRSVWPIATEPYAGAHFAVMPTALVKPCILAGCPEGGTVLDPFGGSGTVGEVATTLGRHAVLCELNPKYVALAEKRTAQQGLFARDGAA
jgi:DNA modification methylase